MDFLLHLRIDSLFLLSVLYVLAGAAFIFLLIKSPLKRTLLHIGLFLSGGFLGWGTLFYFVDYKNIFDVSFSTITSLWLIVFFATVPLVVVSFFRSKRRRKIIAAVALPVFFMSSAAAINVDFGAYSTLEEAFGLVEHQPLNLSSVSRDGEPGLNFFETTNQKAKTDSGIVGTVNIPAPISGFQARSALVYLPPIALVDHPPKLPVLYAFSGQPGSPDQVFSSGRIHKVMDAFALENQGYAPIVVVPDQLGAPDKNPMCVDSKTFGAVETYLVQDVRNWIMDTFRVSTDVKAWGIFGFSQGGTCAVQIASKFPDIFGSAIIASSQIGPTLASEADTIAKGFDGSPEAFANAQPVAIMQAHAPYQDHVFIFGAGERDSKFTEYAHTLNDAATAAGIQTEFIVAPAHGHDWNAARYILKQGFSRMAIQMGIVL